MARLIRFYILDFRKENIMKNNKINIFKTILIFFFLLILSVTAWLKPTDDYSVSERRALKKMPQINIQNIISGNFSKNFEEYSLDQFPLRNEFRKIKAFNEFNFLNKSTNNNVYSKNEYLGKLEYPQNSVSIKNANNRINYIYEKYLTENNTKVFISVVPDKNYFLINNDNNYLSINYDEFINEFKNGNKYIKNNEIKYIDIFSLLSLDSFYRTDTHWKQEALLPVAEKISKEMGVELKAQYETKTLDNDFYGVYYGQYGLPTKPDEIKYLDNEILTNVTVFNHENQKQISVYDMDKAYGNDPYEMFLSGPISLITIENEKSSTEKELIIFRDSFASSLAPLFVEGYKKITLIDTRYIHPNTLESFVDFKNSDVLFLYSTSVLNNSETFK